ADRPSRGTPHDRRTDHRQTAHLPGSTRHADGRSPGPMAGEPTSHTALGRGSRLPRRTPRPADPGGARTRPPGPAPPPPAGLPTAQRAGHPRTGPTTVAPADRP